MKNSIVIILLFISTVAFSQMPQINSIDKNLSYPGDTIVIAGSNFSANAANMQVLFGAVAGEIVSSTSTLLQVRVPEGAHFDNIAVTNLTSGLTAYSFRKFFTSYSGDEAFNPTEFSAPVIYNAQGNEKEFYDLCSCDLDGDDKPDIVTTKFADAVDLMILHNTSTLGNLSFNRLSGSELPALNLGAPTSNVICTDVNGDGKPDIMASRSGGTRNQIFVLQNTTTGGVISFASAKVLIRPTLAQYRRLAVADLNFDGKPEVVVTNAGAGDFDIFTNNSTTSSISFEDNPTTIAVNALESTSGIELQDLDGDRKPDIILTGFFQNHVYVLKNNSTSENFDFSQQQELSLIGDPLLNVRVADLDYDGYPDVIASSTSRNRLIIFPNTSNSSISFGAPKSINTGMGPWGMDLADMNGDGKLDVIAGTQNQQQVTVLINNTSPGTFTFNQNSVSTALNTRNVLGNDFDGDGKPDLAYTAFIPNTGPYRLAVVRNLNCFVPRFVTPENLAICPGQTKLLEAVPNPAATYSWSKDGTSFPGTENSISITDPGEYTVTATSEGGACTITRTYTVLDGTGDIPDAPVPDSNTPACVGESINLTVQELTGAVYSWTGPNGFTSNEREPVIQDATPENAGLYTVTIKIGDCLSSESSVAVDVATLPVFTAGAQGPLNFCEGTSNRLTVTQRSGFSYQWYHDGSAISGATGSTYDATSSGTYHVQVTDDASNCTLTTNQLELNVYTAPVADFTLSDATVCTDEEVLITNNSSTDPDATTVYTWDTGDGSTLTAEEPALSYSSAGDYIVELTVNYNGVAGCSSTTTANLSVVEGTIPAITASATEICPDESAELSVAGGFTEINWSTGEQGEVITVEDEGVYTVNTLDANGCPGEETIQITFKNVPDLEVSASTETIPATTDTINVTPGNVNLMVTGADTYSWAPEELLDNAMIAEPVASINNSVTFYVTGILTGGCSAMDSIHVRVNIGGELPISPKKVYSPESTRNPTWDIDLTFLSETCHFTLFDERGTKILEEEGQIFSWDGTISGNLLPEGVYYYIVGCPEGGKKAGTVLLVRN